jgi:hypothetical protein
MISPYEILGLDINCTDEEITKAYRRLAKIHHPDICGENETFVEISKSVEILRDPEKRKMFDDYGVYFDESIDNIISTRFNELVTMWVDKQLLTKREINIQTFFFEEISEVRKNTQVALDDIAKAKSILSKISTRIKTTDNKDRVSLVVKSKVASLDATIDRIEKDKVILSMIEEISNKYSSFEEMQQHIEFRIGGTSTTSNTWSQFVRSGY